MSTANHVPTTSNMARHPPQQRHHDMTAYIITRAKLCVVNVNYLACIRILQQEQGYWLFSRFMQ